MKRCRFRVLQIAIILFVILPQAIVFKAESRQRGNYREIVNMIDSVNVSGQALYFSNHARIEFQEAQMLFNQYMVGKNETLFQLYKESIQNVGLNADSLDLMAGSVLYLRDLMAVRNDYELQIGQLKLTIDSLLGQETSPRNGRRAFVPATSVQQILKSITYDTLRTVYDTGGRTQFGRTGPPSYGNQNVRRDKVDIVVTVNYGNRVIVGSSEEHFAHILSLSNENFKGVVAIMVREKYSKLRELVEKLLKINQEILSLDNQLLSEFNMLFAQVQQKYKESIDYNRSDYTLPRERLNTLLFVVFLLASLGLIGFLYRNFRYEKDLERANKTICENLLAKEKLISLISHDIRIPLNLISIYSGQLKKKFPEVDKMEKFALLQYTANNTLLFSNQILELAATENAKEELNNTSSNLKEVLTPILKTLTTLTEENGNTLEVHELLPDNIMVKIDRGKLFRLYYNLVGNANSYTRKGTINVRFNLAETETGYLFKSSIEDDGMGIEEKFLDKLFDPYSQVESKGQYNHFGVGLGLYLSKETVNLYNGTINIKSKVGQGTGVFFELQLERVLNVDAQ